MFYELKKIFLLLFTWLFDSSKSLENGKTREIEQHMAKWFGENQTKKDYKTTKFLLSQLYTGRSWMKYENTN